MAKVHKAYVLNLPDIDKRILKAIETFVTNLVWESLCMLGEPGKGKTPCARVFCRMLSRYHGGEGHFRSANCLDFFRGVPGRKTLPCILDDPCVDEQDVKKVKAFSDVADEEVLTKERWTAAKFVQGQTRLV